MADTKEVSTEQLRHNALVEQANMATKMIWVTFQKEGMLTVPAGDNVARLLPPLNIDESHINEAMDIINRVGKNWAAGDG